LPMVLPRLQEVVDRSRGRWSVAGMIDKLARDDWQLWVVWSQGEQEIKAVLATELSVEMTGMKIAQIKFCVGEGSNSWLHLLNELEAWAVREGAEKLDVIARKGWARKLQDFKMTHVLLEKDI